MGFTFFSVQIASTAAFVEPLTKEFLRGPRVRLEYVQQSLDRIGNLAVTCG